LRRGLGQVKRVVVIADGAVWIWNLSQDRFGEAAQRLDFYHAVQHLWAVAAALHGRGTPEAKAWMKPLTRQLKKARAPK
jgi:transposase